VKTVLLSFAFSENRFIHIFLFSFSIQLEKLQAENAQEWASREKLETEKLALERENKKLKAEVMHMEDELNRRSRQANVVLDHDMKSIQEELSDKIKVGFIRAFSYPPPPHPYYVLFEFKNFNDGTL